MGGIFGGGGSPQIMQQPEPPTRSDADVRSAALAERKRRAMATGRAETIKTSPQGVTEQAQIVSKTLLGA